MNSASNGSEIVIAQTRKYAYANAHFSDTQATLSLRSVGSDRLAFLDNRPLGKLTQESFTVLIEEGVLKSGTVNVEVTLNSPPGNSAIIRPDADSIRYPWQLQAQQPEASLMPERADGLRSAYSRYADRVRSTHPQLSNGIDLDRAVAALAARDGHGFKEIASLLSRSDTLLGQRPHPDSPEFNAYVKKAKAYVVNVCQCLPELRSPRTTEQGMSR